MLQAGTKRGFAVIVVEIQGVGAEPGWGFQTGFLPQFPCRGFPGRLILGFHVTSRLDPPAGFRVETQQGLGPIKTKDHHRNRDVAGVAAMYRIRLSLQK